MVLKINICYLKGVGEKRAASLAKLGILTVEHLLAFFPRDYIDFTSPHSIQSAPLGVKCTVKAAVFSKTSHRISGGGEIHKVICTDDTGEITINFFNNPYTPKKLETGTSYYFFGKITGNFLKREMSNPEILSEMQAETSPFVAIYPQTKGITSTYISKCVKTALNSGHNLPEPLNEELLTKYKLTGKREAIQNIHFPKNTAEISSARRRLIFEELFLLQIGLLALKSKNSLLKINNVKAENSDISSFISNLPFCPTNAQMRCINEILSDFKSSTPMNRLLQGDVGSGKTMVAAAGAFVMAQNGYQSVLMAPTEILAMQHSQTLHNLLSPLGVKTALLTANVKGKARKELLLQIESGEVHFVVGTHALLSDGVVFNNLAFAITDEQHRFGVKQRSKLTAKAQNPHVLVMSATPIPRTLALLMFADLDISLLDEMPKGRKRIKTYAITGKKRKDMYGFLNGQIKSGRQAYIVCPAIDESEDNDMQAVTAYYEQTAKPLLQGFSVGLMHGRLKAAQKAQIMSDFKENIINALVSTTVIEVGVDVPNANIIVIENAERYGLSALHQLRGRVGRGVHESHCILISDNTNEATKQRLSFLCNNSNGFDIAKYDLEIRGPGDFFGKRQHGLPTLKIADLNTDTRTLYAAQYEAAALIESDASLQSEKNSALRKLVAQLFEDSELSFSV